MDMITDFLSLTASNIWLYGGSFLLVLSILVIVHEWGHYAAARACGVRVDEFSVGFGREIWGWTDRAGTRWKISLLPLGGYVKMFGDSDPASAKQTDQVGAGTSARPMTEAERAQAFFSKSVPQRAFIVFAGPVINFIFAIIVLAGVFMTQGQQITPAIASAVQLNAPGAVAGILPGDRVLAIDGRDIQSFDQLRRATMLALDTPLQLSVQRGAEVITITATPERKVDEDRFGFQHERGFLGVMGPNNGFALKDIVAVAGTETGGDVAKTRALLLEKIGTGPFAMTLTPLTKDQENGQNQVTINPPEAAKIDLQNPESDRYDVLLPLGEAGKEYRRYTLFSSLQVAVNETYRITRDSLYAIGQMITGVRSASELGGMIRIGTLAGDMANAGVIALLTFTALLSINLGMVNLFPIPMLDGGHLVMYATEALRGKPVPDHIQEYAFRFGLVILVFLMAFSNLNDIMQLVL